MDQKKQFLLLIGALVIIIVLIILVPGPNFGQISLVSNNGQPAAVENILKDPTLALTGGEWEVSTSAFENTVAEDGVHTITTGSTGLILTQQIDGALLRGKNTITISGTLQSDNERDTFFLALRDTEGREIYRNSVNPATAFTLKKELTVTEKTFAERGLTLSIELPGNASYKADAVSVSVQ